MEGATMRMAVYTALALLGGALATPVAVAGPAEEVRAVYGRFLAAQNARDLAQVRAVLLDSPEFLWVSDGRSVWGPDALVERMGLFQRAEVWRVEPKLDRAVAVAIDERAAYLHLPLVLTIGPAAGPDRLPFLVSVLGVETEEGWRIAALFTTDDKARR
jgi:hypothetical protein